MKKLFCLLLAVSSLSVAAVAQAPKQPVRNHALATHHTIKGAAGVKKVGRAIGTVAKDTVFGAYDALEASVDTFGLSLQAFADAVDMGIAAPLESLPKPLNNIGLGVHYVYEGLDAAGQFLAK
jgi:hypothetical protein